MEYRVLGPLEVVGDGGPVALGGPRPRALVALLLAAEGQALPIDVVADELWSTEPPPSAAATLHTYVSRLRRVLPEGVLITERGSYALRPDGSVDADAFVVAVTAGRDAFAAGDFARSTELLSGALTLWRGDALPELVDTTRGRAAATRLEEMRRGAEEDRFAAELARGRHHELVPELEAAVTDQPLRERRWGQLMVALYRAGRQADALGRYQTLRALLAEELGLDPSPELGQLEQQILVQDPALAGPGEAAPERAVPARPLPAPVTSFVGRTVEAAELSAAMRANRLLTVVGPGGVGKSRLAVELVRSYHAEERDDVVAFVELAAVTDGAVVQAAVAAALGLDEFGGADFAELLRASIGGRGALVVLDNCEHLLDPIATIADAMLGAVAELRIIATSREPLGVAGEAVWRVDSMAEDDAVRLFRDRAGKAADGAEETTVRAVCARLDGLPLAIELAAARLRSVALDDLHAGLDDRFALLGRGPRTGPERQRTLHALVQWSHDLLDTEDQRLLAALSVFAGTFDARAAEAVGSLRAGTGVSRLADLADKSLVVLQPGNRYGLLETIRQFAAERLQSSRAGDATRDAHLAWFHAFATAVAPELRGASQVDALRRCDAERDNIRAAIEWASGDSARAEKALDIAISVFRFWLVRGYLSEARQLFAASLASAPDPGATRAWALHRAGALAEAHGDLTAAARLQDEAIALAREVGDADVEALALNEVGNTRRAAGDLAGAAQAAQQALDVARAAGASDTTTATCLVNLANTWLRDGRQQEARGLYEDAVEVWRRVGDDFGVGTTLQNLGVVAYQSGDLPAALAYTKESAAIVDRLGNKQGRAAALDMTAQIELAMGNHAAAEASSEEALVMVRELGNGTFLSIALATMASIRLASGGDAASTIEEKLALDRRTGFAAGEAEALALQSQLHAQRGETDFALAAAAEALDKARASGDTLITGETLGTLGRLALEAGDAGGALALFEEQLAIWRDIAAQGPRLERALASLEDARQAIDAPPAGSRRTRPVSPPGRVS